MQKSRQLKEMAEECRSLAMVSKTPEIREQLFEVAGQFERLARHRDFVEIMSAALKERQSN
jgi:hypothetical protein